MFMSINSTSLFRLVWWHCAGQAKLGEDYNVLGSVFLPPQ